MSRQKAGLSGTTSINDADIWEMAVFLGEVGAVAHDEQAAL
jgi:hypothetical protein